MKRNSQLVIGKLSRLKLGFSILRQEHSNHPNFINVFINVFLMLKRYYRGKLVQAQLNDEKMIKKTTISFKKNDVRNDKKKNDEKTNKKRLFHLKK